MNESINARNMETGITADYMTLLDSFLQRMAGRFDICPVLDYSNGRLDLSISPNIWK